MLTHYERCNQNIVEDVAHYFWECWKVIGVWRWIKKILPLTSVDPQPSHLSVTQALIGEPLEYHVSVFW